MKKENLPRSEIISEKYKKDNCNHWYVKSKCLCGLIIEQREKRAGGLCKKCRAKFLPPPKRSSKNLTGSKIGSRYVLNEYYDPVNKQVYLNIICDCGYSYHTRKYLFLNSKNCIKCKFKYSKYQSEFGINNKKKKCTNCKIIKDVNLFYKNKKRKDGLTARCKSCDSVYKKSIRYSLTENDIKNLKQYCEICGSDSNLHIDHCHKSGAVRGRLCQYCNHGLGNFKDNINLLIKAIQYLGGIYDTTER